MDTQQIRQLLNMPGIAGAADQVRFHSRFGAHQPSTPLTDAEQPEL